MCSRDGVSDVFFFSSGRKMRVLGFKEKGVRRFVEWECMMLRVREESLRG